MLFQAKEEVEALEKKMVQLENELVTTTTNLENTVKKLEEREKALQNVSQLLRLLQLILCMPSTPKTNSLPCLFDDSGSCIEF